MPVRLASSALMLVLLAACTPERQPEPSPPPLAEPRVDMRADPPPPYTYWAPEGATIRNHPTQPDIWVAEIDGRPAAYYFGDDCGAAGRQAWVGRDLASLSGELPEASTRIQALGQPVTADLRRDRLNVMLDAPDGRVVRVECG